MNFLKYKLLGVSFLLFNYLFLPSISNKNSHILAADQNKLHLKELDSPKIPYKLRTTLKTPNKSTELLQKGRLISQQVEDLPTQNISSSSQKLSDYIRKIPDNSFYILGPGDCFLLEIAPRAKEINNTYCIDGQGLSSFPRLKRIFISGLTIGELTDVFNKEYATYVNEPDAEIRMTRYRPVNVYIDGEIDSPGLYTLSGSSLPSKKVIEDLVDNSDNFNQSSVYNTNQLFPSVIDVLRSAGGVTMRTDLRSVEITRLGRFTNNNRKIKIMVDLTNTLKLEDTSDNIRVFDGDKIFISKTSTPIASQISQAMQSNINPKYINVMIAGRVNKAGNIKVNGFSTLNDAMDLAGGKKIVSGPINFIRYKKDGTIDRRNFRFRKSSVRGSYKNPYLRNGDIIYVGRGLLDTSSEVLSEISSPFLNIFTSIGLYKALTN